MASIPQLTLFGWEEIEKLGDLERLRLILEYLLDEELMRALEKERGKGRNDYLVRAMWNSILAGIIYEHSSIESLIRELSRNGQLRLMCGFHSNGDIPRSYVYSRFLKKLFTKEEMLITLFNKLVTDAQKLLPNFGKNLAIDGQAISSLAKGANKNMKELTRMVDCDQRR